MKLIRLLVISHIFPNNMRVGRGIFVIEQLKALLHSKQLRLDAIVAPVAWAPRILAVLRKKWQDYRSAEGDNIWQSIRIHRPRYICMPGVQFFWLDGIFLALRLFFHPAAGRQYDVIHAHTLLPDGFAAVIMRRRMPAAKVVCTVHGSDISIYPQYNFIIRAMTKYVLKNADRIVCVSEYLRDKVLLLEPSASVVTIRNGIDTNRFRAERVNRENDSGETIFLYVGNVLKLKGVADLVEAFTILKKDNPRMKLLIVGRYADADFPFSIEEWTARSVELIGEVPNEAVSGYMSAADVFVLPSYSEGLPTVMLEAMACKLPLIMTKVGGIPEVLTDGVSALLIEPGDIDGLVKAMNRMATDSRLRKTLSDAAHEHLLANLTWERNVEEIVSVYNQVLEGR